MARTRKELEEVILDLMGRAELNEKEVKQLLEAQDELEELEKQETQRGKGTLDTVKGKPPLLQLKGHGLVRDLVRKAMQDQWEICVMYYEREKLPLLSELGDCLKELVRVIDDKSCDIDSFTTQPAKAVLAKLAKYHKGEIVFDCPYPEERDCDTCQTNCSYKRWLEAEKGIGS